MARSARSQQKRRRSRAVVHSISSRLNLNRDPPGPSVVKFFAPSRQHRQRFLHRRLSSLFMSMFLFTRLRFSTRQNIRSCRRRSTPCRHAQLYAGPMHPEIVRSEQGHCPKCGMTLVPIKETKPKAEHPMPNPEHAAHQMHGEHATHNANDMALPQRAEHEHEMKMQSSVNIADPMNRESSGTAWVPDSTPMYGYMKMLGDDMLMLHGGIFPRYTNVTTRRGDDRIDAPNCIMATYSHPFSDTTQIRRGLMISPDPPH